VKRAFRKISLTALAFALIFSYNVGAPKAVEITVSAKSAVVMEASTGRVLYQKNAHEKMPMASTTKIMTALVAIENGSLSDVVTVGPNASGIEGSSIWLSAGETLTLSDMLFGLMLASGNDAAIAIAEHIGGSVEAFVDMMNAKAREIGAYNTHFVNPNGLPAGEHYTTAYDLALISACGMQNKTFREIVNTQYKTLPWEGHEWDRVVKNKNKILWNYEGGNGIKTGFTKEAGRCLAAGAEREGMQLVSVVLCAPDMFNDCMALMDYGFENYDNSLVVKAGEKIGDIAVKDGMEKSFPVYTEEDIYFPLTQEEAANLKKRVYIDEKLTAPVQKGQQVGHIDLWLGEDKIQSVALSAPYDIGENSYNFNLSKLLGLWLNRRIPAM
jgi:D-alanyl-D-alanine carboxypeptidase (penicillin-binding protein 5/6)